MAEAFVTGEHTVRREGGTLVVEGGLRFGGDEEGGPRFSFSQLPQTLAWARSLQSDRLVVRVNPALPFELDAVGSSVRISGGEAGAKMRLLATALKVDGLRGPLDVDASSSSVKGTIGPSGSSRIAAESSSVKVEPARRHRRPDPRPQPDGQGRRPQRDHQGRHGRAGRA